MIGMILVTHGRLAEELRAAMEHVVGAQRNVATVCIGPEDDMENRRADIEACIARCDTGDGVVLLTDMFGGTPSNLAISMMDHPGRRGDRRRQPADAGQAGEGPLEPAARGRGELRPGGGPQIHRRRLARAARREEAERNLRLMQDGGEQAPDPPTDRPAPVVSRSVIITNRRGLHARAAAKFVTLAERFEASVDVIRDGQSVPARSIMGLMMLGAGYGATIELRAEGWGAKEALDALAALVESGFEEGD